MFFVMSRSSPTAADLATTVTELSWSPDETSLTEEDPQRTVSP